MSHRDDPNLTLSSGSNRKLKQKMLKKSQFKLWSQYETEFGHGFSVRNKM